jgi:E3 ubiquitin-protein ligase HERC2
MEYNHLQDIPVPVLRNRLVLLHHFSNQFCKSLSLFGLQPNFSDVIAMGHEAKGLFGGFDGLRYILLSSSKARWRGRREGGREGEVGREGGWEGGREGGCE